MQFSKRNKQTPLLPLPEIKFNLPPKSGGSRDQLRPGSLLHKRKEPGNEVVLLFEKGVLLFEKGVLLFEKGVLLFEKGVLLFEKGVLLFEKGVWKGSFAI